MAKRYNTRRAEELSGVSRRNLNLWRRRELLIPTHDRNPRYSIADILRARMLQLGIDQAGSTPDHTLQETQDVVAMLQPMSGTVGVRIVDDLFELGSELSEADLGADLFAEVNDPENADLFDY